MSSKIEVFSLFLAINLCFYHIFSGKWLSSRQIRCNWATKGATSGDDKLSSDGKSVVELTTGSSGCLSITVQILMFFSPSPQMEFTNLH